MEGWIKIHRKIQENWLWQEKRKFSKFEAWMSLLLKANHKENKILIGNDIIRIPIGSFITSEVKLSDEWNWSRNTVRKFLMLLENEKMLKKFCTTKYTMLSIENWALYQFDEQQVEHQVKHQRDSKLNTNKNDKNIKNIYTSSNDDELKKHFDLTWENYPNKQGRSKAEKYFLQWVKGRKINGRDIKLTDKQMYLAVKKYKKECEDKGTEKQYIKHGSTFFNEAILDYVEKENE